MRIGTLEYSGYDTPFDNMGMYKYRVLLTVSDVPGLSH